MDPAPSALLGLAVLGFVPGALLYQAIRPTGSRFECVAIAPTLSFAFVFLFGEVATLTGVPFAPVPFLVVVSATAAVAGWRRRARKVEFAQTPSWSTTSHPAAALLAGGIILSAFSWLLGIHGVGSTPPHTDSVNHGVMAAQVANRESLDPGRVLNSDVLGRSSRSGETAYYPLALHGQVALAKRLFGISFADGLLASTLLFSVFVLPIGLYFAVRTLVPANPILAGLTALLGATNGFFPLLPLSFGGLPLVIGMAMVPAVAVVAGRYLTDRGTFTDATVGVLGALGILATHTSEIPLLAVLLGGTAFDALLRRRQSITVLVRRIAVFGGICALLAAPTLPLIAGGTNERSGIGEGRVGSIVHALTELRSIVGEGTAAVLGLLALIGAMVCVKHRRHLAMIASLGGVLTLYFIASCLNGTVRALTVPWYQHPGRIALNLVLLIPFFAAVALVELGPALWRGHNPGRLADRVAPGVAVALVLAVAGSAFTGTSLRTLFKGSVIVGADARVAFAYLRSKVTPGERVFNDANTDGAMWMYPFDGVVPVMGLQPARPGQSWRERLWLMENLPALGRDPRVDEYLHKYNVRFVYWDDKTFLDEPHHLDGEALRNTPRLCERLHRGSVRVFEVVALPGCS